MTGKRGVGDETSTSMRTRKTAVPHPSGLALQDMRISLQDMKQPGTAASSQKLKTTASDERLEEQEAHLIRTLQELLTTSDTEETEV